ncbi:MAG: 3-hydroxyacyl-CoA dehydrogenase (Hbd-3), partial [Archaeoglobus fulgidus]
MFEKIGVVGFGLMGTQITQFFAQQGLEVVAIDVSEERLRKGMEAIKAGRFGLQRLVEKGKITEEEMNAVLSRISTSTSHSALKDCDLVIEAVFEDVNLKLKVLREIDAVTDAVIGSNTSSISITKLSSAVSNPERFLGIHFFNPAQIQKLVELVKGLLSDEKLVNGIRDWFLKLG